MKNLLLAIAITGLFASLSACEKAEQATQAIEKARSASEDLRKEAGKVKETLLGPTDKGEREEARLSETRERTSGRDSDEKDSDHQDD